MNNSISTEGRIYAQQMMRAVKVDEAKGAAIISEVLKVTKQTSWEQAVFFLTERIKSQKPLEFKRVSSPKKQEKLFAAACKKRNQEFVMLLRKLTGKLECLGDTCRVSVNSRFDIDVFRMCNLHAGDHTFVEMEGQEQAIIVLETVFTFGYDGCDGRVNIPSANVSEHTLGRLHDRLPLDARKLNIGFDFIHECATMGVRLPHNERLVRSGINFFFGEYGLVATGSMKVGGIGNGMASPFFDCRTVLTSDMCTDEQLEQAKAIAVLQDCMKRLHVTGSADGLPNPMDVFEAIPFVAPRPDYVSETTAARHRKLH